jgi:hypothetical protein
MREDLMSKSENRKRSLRAMEALLFYSGEKDKVAEHGESSLVDLLADLMHYSEAHDIDFDYALDVAGRHFREELQEAE